MAGQAPDPRTLNSWEDAFQYPLPVVRKLEQQLRKNIDENRQKLRSLVGASYRDLLGTAERIIEMDEQMTTVESSLSSIGRKANARTVERMGENYARLRATRDSVEKKRLQTLAQIKVLQSALTASSRTIKAGGDALVAAKLLVLARLLHKSISEADEPPAILHDLGRKLGQLRKKLMSYAERALVKPVTDKVLVANTLCAYAIISSSAPKDVLRNFLQARLEQIESKLGSATSEKILQAIALYRQTLLDTRALFPRQYMESLSHLSKLALLQDGQIRSLSELSLDIYEVWINDDIRTFTPWVRQDQLPASDVYGGLSAWSARVQRCLEEAVSEMLGSMTETKDVVVLRKKVLSQYLRLASELPDYHQTDTISTIRQAFVDKLRDAAYTQAEAAQSLLENVDASSTDAGGDLWELSLTDFDLTNGALSFRDAIVGRRHGRTTAVQTVREALDDWTEGLESLWDISAQIRTVRWDAETDIDLEDVPDGDDIVEALTKNDSGELQTVIRNATGQALQYLRNRIRTMAGEPQVQPVVLIRLLREVHDRRRELVQRMAIVEGIESDHTTVAELHDRLADNISSAALERYAKSLQKASKVSTALWDGSPPLPLQPSPATYRLLASLQTAMSNMGIDVWSPAATDTLKQVLDRKLADLFATVIDKADPTAGKPLVNGHAKEEDGSEDAEPPVVNGDAVGADATDRRLLQLLFDVLYLQRITAQSSKEAARLQVVSDKLLERMALAQAARDRLKKSANEYWKRTYLLLGLLASGGP